LRHSLNEEVIKSCGALLLCKSDSYFLRLFSGPTISIDFVTGSKRMTSYHKKVCSCEPFRFLSPYVYLEIIIQNLSSQYYTSYRKNIKQVFKEILCSGKIEEDPFLAKLQKLLMVENKIKC